MESLRVPRVSVLIPAYNAEPTVRAAVDSILRQTFTDLEAIIVDDGSTDATPGILDAYSERDSRVRVVHTANRGIIEALNTGIGECRGELIARMDADDISHPRRLEAQVALMDAHPDVSVCSSLVRMFPRQRLLGGLVRYEEWLNSLVTPEQIAHDMFVESPVAHPSVMLRRNELVELGACDPSTSSGCCAYQEHGWAEDYDLWLRYHTAGKRFAKVDKTLLWWRQSEGRLTFTDSRYSVENFLRAKAHYVSRQLSAISIQRPVCLWGAGKTGRRLLKHLGREGVDIRAIIDIDRDKIGRTMRGKPIVGVDYLCPGFVIPQGERYETVQHPDPETSCAGAALPFVIAAVSSHGARRLIREQLRAFGFVEPRDFVCAA